MIVFFLNMGLRVESVWVIALQRFIGIGNPEQRRRMQEENVSAEKSVSFLFFKSFTVFS